MRMTIYVGGGAAMFVCLDLILAIPDMHAVLAGEVKDPVAAALTSAVGLSGFKAVVVVVLVSFISCLLSLQAAASRLLFGYGRDEMVAGSNKYLSQLSPRTHVPVTSLVLCGAIACLISVAGLWLKDAISAIIAFSSSRIDIGFHSIL